MTYEIQFTAKLFLEDKDILELFQRVIKEVMPEDEHSYLIQLSQTNWGGTSLQFQNFVELFPAIIAAYDEICDGSFIKDSDKLFQASGK